MTNILDQYIHRFQNLPSFNLHQVNPDGLSAVPWFEVKGEKIAEELIFDELNPMPQVDTIAADIQKWGRLEAQAQRVWQMAERDLRTWQAKFMLKLYEGEEKTPPKHIIEAKYRKEKKYHTLYVETERAEEAYNATHAVMLAFRAKKDMLQRYATKYRDG